jgi:hypothetical protein
MNYIQTIEDTIHIIRTTKLVWVFGFLSLLGTLNQPLLQLLRGNSLLICIYLPVSFTFLYFSFIAGGGLIYVIYQKTLGRDLSFSDVWLRSKSKIFSVIGSSIPGIILAIIVYMVLTYVLQNSQFFWVIGFIAGSFICSFFTFSACAIMINDVKASAAIWTGFLIAVNNFFRVLIITGTVYFIRLLLTGIVLVILLLFGYPTNQSIMGIPIAKTAVWIFYLMLGFPYSVFLTLGYLRFTEEISYPALSIKQNAA